MFFIYLLQREIFEMCWPIVMKFCAVISSTSSFIMPVQNFRGHPPKNFRGQKHAKFGPILDDFKVWCWIFPKMRKIFKVEQVHFLPWFLPR